MGITLRVVQKLRDSGLAINIATVYYYMGILYYDYNEDYEKAIIHMNLAREYAEKTQNQQLLITVQAGLGNLYAFIGDYEKSLRYKMLGY